MPARRDEGKSHEVAKFNTPFDAVAAYMRNLNSHPRYDRLRKIRKQLRDSKQPINGTLLADGLLAYSERGAAYVTEVKAMIRQNKLE